MRTSSETDEMPPGLSTLNEPHMDEEKPQADIVSGTKATSNKHVDGSLDSNDTRVYPPMKKVLPAMVSIYLALFLIALDRTIIGTAIPSITREFDSFGDVAWYESGFLLPLCVLQLSFGLVYRYYSTRWVLFALTAVFEIGSIICAAAPNSNALIVGRVVTGIGAAGIAPGTYLLITFMVPLSKRPPFLGSIGSVFGISAILGPILGGYLTAVTWRWCFWINVPIGGVALVLLLLLAPNLPPPAQPAKSLQERFMQLDPIGFLLVGPCIACLLFALQFGGADQNWSQARVIVAFVFFAALLLAFVAYQGWKGEKATVPPRIMNQRVILASCLVAFCIGSVLVLFAFYLPIWFQVVQGKSPQKSGLALLPLLLSNVVSVVATGVLVGKIGYYMPFSVLGGAILITGSALVTTWTADINDGKRIGYQIVTGLGLGMSLQLPNLAAQTVLSESDQAVGMAVLNFAVYLGGSIFVTASQTLLEDQLVKKLTGLIPGLDPSALAGSGAPDLAKVVPHDKLHQAASAYNESMRSIWYLALALACGAFFGAFGLGWKSVKAKDESADKHA